ncbi:hypothetical protein ACM26V_00095 [Salipaludibacillus sp. HK11]|uniref:hypothetical protein n=1 Tax=Salipaludibacillus sp. HK11 TaxID=3394320 RepID=UPI0039FBB9A5
MEVQVRSINFSDKIQVRFVYRDDNRDIDLSGHVTITEDEYETNAPLTTLAELVKQKVINKLESGEPIEEGAE